MKHATSIRPFRDIDAPETARIFFDSVHLGTRSCYDECQRRAWAPRVPETPAWLERLASQTVFVAERNGRVVGFMGLTADGCIDLAFVAPQAIRQGIGKALYDAIFGHAVKQGLARLYTETSHLARPFFERQGWSLVSPQTLLRDGVFITNVMMEKPLH